MGKFLTILLLSVSVHPSICLSQIKVLFEKDTIIAKKSRLNDTTKFINIIINNISKDSSYLITIEDTHRGSLPSIDYNLNANMDSLVVSASSTWDNQIYPIILKKDTTCIDRDRSIILKLNLFKKKDSTTFVKIKDALLVIAVKHPLHNRSEFENMPLPSEGDAATVCFKKEPVKYWLLTSTSIHNLFIKNTVDYKSIGTLRIDSVAMKFEDKTLSEVQVFAFDKKANRSFEFENRFQIPLKGSRNHANLTKYKLVDYRNPEGVDHENKKIIKRFIYLGDVIRVMPILENYTFDYSPTDTVIGIGKSTTCTEPKKLPRAPLVSLAELRIMNDLLAALANKPNGLMQAQMRVRLQINLINYRHFTFFHSIEILGKYSTYSKENRFLQLNTAEKTNAVEKYANLMDVIERPAFYIGARANVMKFEQRPSSTKINFYLFGGIGYTSVRDTAFSKPNDSTAIKQIDNKIIKSSVIGVEMRIKFMERKGFFAEIGSQLLAPFILTKSVNEDISTRLEPEEIKKDSLEKFIPKSPENFKDRLIIAPYINFAIYPNKGANTTSLHVRAQWFKSLVNRNSFLQVQFGSNINLSKVLGKLKN
jgi:hypothetical protein